MLLSAILPAATRGKARGKARLHSPPPPPKPFHQLASTKPPQPRGQTPPRVMLNGHSRSSPASASDGRLSLPRHAIAEARASAETVASAIEQMVEQHSKQLTRSVLAAAKAPSRHDGGGPSDVGGISESRVAWFAMQTSLERAQAKHAATLALLGQAEAMLPPSGSVAPADDDHAASPPHPAQQDAPEEDEDAGRYWISRKGSTYFVVD